MFGGHHISLYLESGGGGIVYNLSVDGVFLGFYIFHFIYL